MERTGGNGVLFWLESLCAEGPLQLGRVATAELLPRRLASRDEVRTSVTERASAAAAGKRCAAGSGFREQISGITGA